MKKKIIFLIALCFFVATNLYAETVVLKSGKIIEARILERNSDSIKVDIEDVGITYFLSDIDSIDGNKIELSTQSLSVAEPNPIVEKGTYNQNIQSAKEPVDTDINKRVGLSGIFPSSDKGKAAFTKVAGIVLAVIAFLVFISYLYGAVCLWFIAKKTNTPNAYLAWIPIANLFLMCKIAAISYLWLLVLFAGFVPYVGMLVGVGFSAFIWYRIALARNKPAWLGVLVCIPLVGLVIMGYLAFSKIE